MSTYLMVSLHTNPLNPAPTSKLDDSIAPIVKRFDSHAQWDQGRGWKNTQGNLRLLIQPFIFFNLIKHWLNVGSYHWERYFVKLQAVLIVPVDAVFRPNHYKLPTALRVIIAQLDH